MAYVHENLVVCGVDGSDESFNALRWAVSEARTRSARLEVVCSYEEPTFSSHVGSFPASFTEETAHDILEKARDCVSDDIPAVFTAVAGDTASILIEKSKSAARVVIGARGGGTANKRMLGSVASALSSRSCCAVVIVPGDSVDNVLPVTHMVCGIDGSAASRGALQLAIREASRWGARLTCVSAVDFGGSNWLPAMRHNNNVVEEIRTGMQQIVNESMQGLDVDVECQAMEGNPAVILRTLSTTVDAIVVGTRGRGGFAGLLLGSTSQTLLQRATCPTIVVPARAADNVNELNMGGGRWDDSFI